MLWRPVLVLAVVALLAPARFEAQVPAQADVAEADVAQSDVEQLAETPTFTVSTVARTTQAVNYRYRRGDTKIDFAGTALAPLTRGEAEVQAKRGAVVVDAEFTGIKPANEFGAEYLTYVLWAVSPQGRAVNLGELVADGYGRAKLKATTELQAFGMVVTAEPYFAVRRPSDLIVSENEVREDTKGEVLPVEAKYELLRRGEYAKLANPLALSLDLGRNPIDLYQARNAVQIARSLHAEDYAAETFGKAAESLARAEDLAKRRASKKDVATLARQAVQVAEDARELSEKRIEQERAENERRAAAEREAAARAQAEEEAQLRAEAEVQRQKESELREQAQQAKTAAERQRLEAELAAAQSRAEMEKALREKERAERLIVQAQAEAAAAREQQQVAQTATAELAAERERLEAAKAAAEQAAAEATREKQELAELMAQSRAELEQARLEKASALAAKEGAELAANSARDEAKRLDALRARAESEAERASREREEMRERMQSALSKVVETQETGRGLILNLPDILFDFGKSTLRGEAREVISRIAGIMMVTPGYRLSIEGHTDSVGSDAFNQSLSEQRAEAVYSYLDEAQVAAETMRTSGFGKTQPIASNDTPEGRQKNRRVEIVIQDERQSLNNE